jgi:outer membrane protein OmpA-like peptidoglycan-associated protein/opacity protein-like surface antigen
MRNYLAFILIVFQVVNYAQSSGLESHPYSGTLSVSLNGGTTIGITDYKEIKMGGTLLGSAEYFFNTETRHIFSIKIFGGGQSIYGRDYRGMLYENEVGYFVIPEIIRTDMYIAGLGGTYSYSLNDVVFPYIGGGLSYLRFSPKDGNGIVTPQNVADLYSKNAISWDVEAGMRFPITDKLGIQFEGAVHFLNTDYIDDIAVGNHNDLYSSFIVGLSYSFFGNKDSDGDGIFDSEDNCALEPEDVDGYQDYDGCPDPDNDLDGILDINDKCPNEAEDLDSFQDNDGCPETDNDSDGIMDRYDQCPNEAEDIDNFQDDDGCPDLDNDGDGIQDKDDKCPAEPETFNGFQDEDGCADAAPLNEGTYAPTEILVDGESTFATNSSEIKPEAFTELDRIVNLLHTYPDAKWRIEGHMDNQNSSDFSRIISLKRAESILNYFILKGLPSYRFEVIGMGDKFPIANNSTEFGRMKNRRIEIVRIN